MKSINMNFAISNIPWTCIRCGADWSTNTPVAMTWCDHDHAGPVPEVMCLECSMDTIATALNRRLVW